MDWIHSSRYRSALNAGTMIESLGGTTGLLMNAKLASPNRNQETDRAVLHLFGLDIIFNQALVHSLRDRANAR